jgi:hypothetical protein
VNEPVAEEEEEKFDVAKESSTQDKAQPTTSQEQTMVMTKGK